LIKAKTPGLWIFWVYASNSSRVEQSFRDIAAKTDLPGHDDLKVDIFPLVSRWLEDNRNGSWLMILDNADDSQLFLQPLSKNEDSGSNTANFKRSLLSFIPQVSHGKVLITSRDRTAAYDLVGNHDNLVKVDPMNVSESLSLLKTKLHIDPAMENDAIELLDTLEYMPLAITQAGAYIRQLAPLMTLQGYLSQFRKNMANQATLLKKNARDIRRDETVSNSIIVTWEISFNQISEQHRPAADLLSLMSMFHRQSIPDFLLREDADEYLAFLDRLNLLINFSLISVESEGNLFHMHRLVQTATRKWLEANQSLQKWKRIATERIATIFPKGDYENLEKGELLWPHAEEVIIYEPLDDESKVLYSGLLSLTANHAHTKGNLALAAQRFEQSLVIRRQILREEDHGFLNCMGNLATILIYQGRWKEAEEMHAHIVERKKRVLGAEHPDTLTSMSNLASIFWCQGQWKEAEELEMQVLNTRKRVLGAEHPDILFSISSLASTFGSQGRWEEAEELEMQVLNTRKRILGAEHPDTLISMSNLALTFAKQGRWKESGELEMQALNMMKKVLGAEHPDTLTSMNNLAIAYCHQQRHDEAIELMKSVIDLSTKKLGPNHPDTLISIQWLDHWLEKKVKSEDRHGDKEKGDKSKSEPDDKDEDEDQGGDQDDDDSEHSLAGQPKADI
jgi:tetratricopeptide (TPR) repeat protein